MSGVIPIAYYHKLLEERDSEKRQRIHYEKANETFASLYGTQSRPNQDEGMSHEYVISNQSQTSTTDVGDTKDAWKGRFLYFPALMTGKTEDDHKDRLEDGQS